MCNVIKSCRPHRSRRPDNLVIDIFQRRVSLFLSFVEVQVHVNENLFPCFAFDPLKTTDLKWVPPSTQYVVHNKAQK